MRDITGPTTYQIRQIPAPRVMSPRRVRNRREPTTVPNASRGPLPDRCTEQGSDRGEPGPHGTWRNLAAPARTRRTPRETALARTLYDAPRPSDGSSAEPATRTRREMRRAGNRLPRGVGPASGRLGYQPALDGIRAFAVAAVLLYHAGQSWAIGGFLGVDTFFVLSGFLITSLLVTEWAGRGRIDLKAFWVRRARRLLPALFLVMVGIVVYAGVFAAPGELDRIRADSFAALGYVANWRFVFSGQSYFDQFSQPSPLRHMWSLAIEEQFYLVWPLIVCFLLWWRRSLRVLLVACLALIAGSAALDGGALRARARSVARVLRHRHACAVVAHRRGGRHPRVPARADPVARWRAECVRIAALVGAGYTLWLFWRMSERTDALYQGGFLLAALAVVGGHRLGGAARPGRARARSCRSRRCGGWDASPTASTSGTGRCTSRSRDTHRSRRRRVARRPARGERRARDPVVLRPRAAHPPGHVPPAEAEGRRPGGGGRAGRSGVRHHHRWRRLDRRDHHARAARRSAVGRRPPRRSNPRAPAAGGADQGAARGRLGRRARWVSGSRPSVPSTTSGCGTAAGSAAGCSTAARSTRVASCSRSTPECDWHTAWPDELDYFKPDIASCSWARGTSSTVRSTATR